MEATELMVKDWVLHEGEPYQIRRLGIHGVDRDGEDYPAVCIGKPKCIGLIVERNEIEPIPLTTEILEKNGLEKDNHGRLSGEYFDEDIHQDLEITVDSKTGEVWWSYNWDEYYIIRLRYVHELQHALRLCGIEKEIIL